MFAEFIGFMQERKNHGRTFMALVPADRERAIIEGTEHITGDLDQKQGAMVMTTDVSFFKGNMNMM